MTTNEEINSPRNHAQWNLQWNGSHAVSRDLPTGAYKAILEPRHFGNRDLGLPLAACLLAIMTAIAHAGEDRIMAPGSQAFAQAQVKLHVRLAVEIPDCPSLGRANGFLPRTVAYIKDEAVLAEDLGSPLPDAPSEVVLKSGSDGPPGPSPPFSSSGEAPIFQIEAPPNVRIKTVDRQFVTLQAIQLSAVVADVETTLYGLSHGGAEVNPFAGSHPSRVRLYAISLPVDALLGYWSYYLKKNAPHSKRWRMLPIIGAGMHGGAALHNLAVSH